ncbi:hypothetical protein [Citrobacter sedlakii]|nr:hypothetical protein [Citrobacter sedlakii]
MAKLKPFMDYIDTRLAENVWNGEVNRVSELLPWRIALPAE